MLVHGMIIEDAEMLRLTLSAVRDGLRQAKADVADARRIERELGLYYMLRDEIRASVERACARVAAESERCARQERGAKGGEA